MNTLSWCGGFFDGEGSFSFAPECASITLVNTNPLAIANFNETMLKNNVMLNISERSKASKSSKKKRWDLYSTSREECSKFVKLMKPYVKGKDLQLNLMENFFEDKHPNIQAYHKIMMYYNQTSHILIKDEKVLYEKLGFVPEVANHKFIAVENSEIVTDDFNDLDYFCGIMDAEGTVYMNQRDTKDNQTGTRFTPSISFTNTNKEIITKCCSTLKNNNIGCHIQFRENRNRGRWDIIVSGVQRAKSLASLIKDRLIIKNRQSEMLYKYCNLRIENPKSLNDYGLTFKEAIELLNKEN